MAVQRPSRLSVAAVETGSNYAHHARKRAQSLAPNHKIVFPAPRGILKVRNAGDGANAPNGNQSLDATNSSVSGEYAAAPQGTRKSLQWSDTMTIHKMRAFPSPVSSTDGNDNAENESPSARRRSSPRKSAGRRSSRRLSRLSAGGAENADGELGEASMELDDNEEAEASFFGSDGSMEMDVDNSEDYGRILDRRKSSLPARKRISRISDTSTEEGDYTVPLGAPIKTKRPSAAYLALVEMAGGSSSGPQGDELVVVPLDPHSTVRAGATSVGDDSISSAGDDSFNMGDGNETVNLTKLRLQRPSDMSLCTTPPKDDAYSTMHSDMSLCTADDGAPIDRRISSAVAFSPPVSIATTPRFSFLKPPSAGFASEATPAPAPAAALTAPLLESVAQPVEEVSSQPTSAPASTSAPLPAQSQPASAIPRLVSHMKSVARASFTAAFAPKHNSPLKRPAPGPAGEGTPAKKQAVGDTAADRKAVPAVAPLPAGDRHTPRGPFKPSVRRVSSFGGPRKVLETAPVANHPAPPAQPAESPRRRVLSASRNGNENMPPQPSPAPAPLQQLDMNRPEELEQSFASASLSPAKGSSTQSLSPMRQPLQLANLENLPSPHAMDPSQWRAAVEPMESDTEPNANEPIISVAQFLEMTGVKFRDDFTCPRYSTALGLISALPTEDHEYSFADYLTAMNVHVPQLDTYQWAANYLQDWIAGSKANFSNAERDVAASQPLLFREYAIADDEERAPLLHEMKLIKAHTLAKARAVWYNWKSGWIASLYEKALAAATELDHDGPIIEQITSRVDQILPTLLEERQRILLELTEEEEVMEEIKEGDQDFLNELIESINEQKMAIETQEVEIAELRASEERLNARAEEHEIECSEAREIVSQAERQRAPREGATMAELSRLQQEIAAVQALHRWTLTSARAGVVELIFADRFRVQIPCDARYVPRSREVMAQRLPTNDMHENEFEAVEQLMDKLADLHARQRTTSVRTILRTLGGLWTRFARLRRELDLLSVKYPVRAEIIPGKGGGFAITAKVLLHTRDARADVRFVISESAMMGWPRTVAQTRAEIDMVYGDMPRDDFLAAVHERIEQSRAEDHYGHLLEACLAGVARCEPA